MAVVVTVVATGTEEVETAAVVTGTEVATVDVPATAVSAVTGCWCSMLVGVAIKHVIETAMVWQQPLQPADKAMCLYLIQRFDMILGLMSR